jgi:hypothetical protein
VSQREPPVVGAAGELQRVARVDEARHKVQEQVLLQACLVELPRRAVARGHEDGALCQERLEDALEGDRLEHAAHLRARHK